jgi:hypothetical protein
MAPAEPGEPWVRDPEDDGWDADGFDGGRIPDRGLRGGADRGGARGAPGSDRAVREFRPGLEALRLAIHRPEDVGHRLEAALFRDDLQRKAFLVLAGADDDLHQAIESAPPDERALLVRLVVEEPKGEPDDVILQLVRDAARGELHLITAEARTSPEASEEAVAAAIWVQELDDPVSSAAATARLVAWLVVRATKNGSGKGS